MKKKLITKEYIKSIQKISKVLRAESGFSVVTSIELANKLYNAGIKYIDKVIYPETVFCDGNPVYEKAIKQHFQCPSGYRINGKYKGYNICGNCHKPIRNK